MAAFTIPKAFKKELDYLVRITLEDDLLVLFAESLAIKWDFSTLLKFGLSSKKEIMPKYMHLTTLCSLLYPSCILFLNLIRQNTIRSIQIANSIVSSIMQKRQEENKAAERNSSQVPQQ